MDTSWALRTSNFFFKKNKLNLGWSINYYCTKLETSLWCQSLCNESNVREWGEVEEMLACSPIWRMEGLSFTGPTCCTTPAVNDSKAPKSYRARPGPKSKKASPCQPPSHAPLCRRLTTPPFSPQKHPSFSFSYFILSPLSHALSLPHYL